MNAAIELNTLADVRTYHGQNNVLWMQVLDYLDRTLTQARDIKKVPIYLTKGRVKQAESAYLKFKRKGRSNPQSITDWIGFRVLCLFQQDVNNAFEFLLDLLLNQYRPSDPINPVRYFGLDEISIFNWPPERANALIQQLTRKLAPMALETTEKVLPDGMDIAYTFVDRSSASEVISFKVRKIDRDSRYQSVHFVARANMENGASVSCEIQLRTLLQDVWGELEHALSYKKGKIHPHISNSFLLLSRELEAKDILVSQLRDIRDQETALVRYSSTSSGPSAWLRYPSNFLADLPEPAQEKLSRYTSLCQTRKDNKNPENWREQTSSLLTEIEVDLKEYPSPNASYLLAMEKAFLSFCVGHIDAAENQYREVIAATPGEDQWFPYFRLGETCLAQEKIGDALVAFDQCEEKMTGSTENVTDCYRAKIGLAYAYWSLGKEFLPTAVAKVSEARNIIEPVLAKEEFEQAAIEEQIRLRFSLINNSCFYYLEHWLMTPDDAVVSEVHKRRHLVDQHFNMLKNLTREHPGLASSNTCDTLAWYCFQVSERAASDADRRRWLEDARKYVQNGESLANAAPSRMISSSIQREHMQLILSKYAARDWPPASPSSKLDGRGN